MLTGAEDLGLSGSTLPVCQKIRFHLLPLLFVPLPSKTAPHGMYKY